MKFGKVRINASMIIALLAALYILMVCREKYFIEYAEGEPAPEEPVAEEGEEPRSSRLPLSRWLKRLWPPLRKKVRPAMTIAVLPWEV